jgi:hypothetical protein
MGAEAVGVPTWVHNTVGPLWRFAKQQGLRPADVTSSIKRAGQGLKCAAKNKGTKSLYYNQID